MVRELHHGGSERQLTEVALGLQGGKFQPHVGAFRVEGIRADELRRAGVPILHLPDPITAEATSPATCRLPGHIFGGSCSLLISAHTECW